MLIYSCTSELYHPPIATIGIIILNILVSLLAMGADPVTVQDYCLWYGEGLHPVQWITSAFLHANAGHLIGNMIFLWPLGLLVEGKVGWWRFLLLYLAISVSECALEQTLMLGHDNSGAGAAAEFMQILESDPEFAAMSEEEREMISQSFAAEFEALGKSTSLGASSVIFGLLAICVLWAPASDFNVWWRFGTFEVPVLVVGGFYTAFEFWNWHRSGFGVGSAALHLLGIVSGVAFGILFLRYNIPKTDGKDLFNHTFDRSIAKTPSSKSKPKVPGKSKASGKSKSSGTPSGKPGKAAAPAIGLAGAASTSPGQKVFAKKAAPVGVSPTGDLGVPSAPSPPATDVDFDLDEPSFDFDQPDPVSELTSKADAGDYMGAAKLIREIKDPTELQKVALNRYLDYYKKAVAVKQFAPASLFLQKSILAYPAKPEARQLEISRLLLLGLKKPDHARNVMSKIDRTKLNEKQAKLFQSLSAKLEGA